MISIDFIEINPILVNHCWFLKIIHVASVYLKCAQTFKSSNQYLLQFHRSPFIHLSLFLSELIKSMWNTYYLVLLEGSFWNCNFWVLNACRSSGSTSHVASKGIIMKMYLSYNILLPIWINLTKDKFVHSIRQERTRLGLLLRQWNDQYSGAKPEYILHSRINNEVDRVYSAQTQNNGSAQTVRIDWCASFYVLQRARSLWDICSET